MYVDVADRAHPYLLGKTSGTTAAGVVVAVDGTTLRDRWQVDWPAGHNFVSDG
jgi:hypothetical protein